MGRKRRARPCFFKILLGDFSRKVKIPQAFVKNFEENQPKKFVLQNTDGKSWRVKMKKTKNGWFLQEGWQHFVMYHSLDVGDLLVFKYNRKSKFRVTIYDRSACEKELPLDKRMNCHPDEVNACEKRMNCHPEEAKPMYHIKKEEEEEEGSQEEKICGAIVPVKQRKAKHDRVLEGVSSFKTERPHFIHIVRSSRKYHVTIPRALALQFDLLSKGSVMLQVPQGISQPVRIIRKSDGRIQLSSGWSEFQQANNLVNGDACIFELVQEMDNAFCVHIFQALSLAHTPIVVEVDPSSYCAPSEDVGMLTYDKNASDGET